MFGRKGEPSRLLDLENVHKVLKPLELQRSVEIMVRKIPKS
jgi:hypothetical protein